VNGNAAWKGQAAWMAQAQNQIREKQGRWDREQNKNAGAPAALEIQPMADAGLEGVGAEKQ
jgi:hypothetical protein